MMPNPLIFAIPKGRILKAAAPLLEKVGIRPPDDCLEGKGRSLRFHSPNPHLDFVRVRSFDVATFVATGGAHIGICGSDVLMEYQYSGLYSPLDLEIGKCRISIAEPHDKVHSPQQWTRCSDLKVATKYPSITRRYFAQKGINVAIVPLHGAMELAPTLGISRLIVDLVDTGSTLRANGLKETEIIAPISSRIIVNRAVMKTQPELIRSFIKAFQNVLKTPNPQNS